MKRLIAITIAALAITGCATTQPQVLFEKPGATNESFAKDRQECEYEALKYGHVAGDANPFASPFRPNTGLYTDLDSMIKTAERKRELTIACLLARGYTRG